MKKVSIIVPIYNGQDKAERCVNSLINQDYGNLQIILLNDGSKDNTAEVLNDLSARDERITVVNKTNSGVSSTRNRGLELADGDYVQFVDVDDYLPADAVKLLVRAIEEDECEMAIGDFYRVVEENVSVKGSISNNGVLTLKQYADEMLKSPADFYYGVLWNKIYRRSIIEQYRIRLDENISFCEDVIFNMEYLKHVNKVSVIKAPVYYYFKTKGSLVEQNMELEKIVRMKTTVISYYDSFYRSVFDENEYLIRKPLIYSYLISVSTDEFSIPLLNSRKLGEETGERYYYNDKLDNSFLMHSYLTQRLINRYLFALAREKKMDQNELMILYFLKSSGKPCSVDEIMQFTGLSAISVTGNLARLVARGDVRLKEMSILESFKDNYEYFPGEFDEALDQLRKDVLSVCFAGMEENQIREYLESRKQIDNNIRKLLNISE